MKGRTETDSTSNDTRSRIQEKSMEFRENLEGIYNNSPISGEKIFISLLLLVAIYMFAASSDYSQRAATFPQIISVSAIIGCILLLVSDYLPEPFRAFVQEETRITDPTEDEKVQEIADVESETSDDLEPINSFYTGVLLTLYVILSYLISFFLATPLFIIAYSLTFDIDKYYAVMLLIASVALVYGFEAVLNVPLKEGAVIEFRGL